VAALVDDLRRIRPLWPRTHLVQAELAMQQDDLRTAIASLQRAWELGERSLLVAQQLLDLLTQAGRYEDAVRFVGEVRTYVKQSPSLFDSAVPYLARGSDANEAIEIAEAFVTNQPNDPQAHLRLGRVLSLMAEGLSGEDPERQRQWVRAAEQAYQEAIRLDRTALQPWAELVLFYSRHPPLAEKVSLALDALEQRVAMSRVDKALLLSRLARLAGMVPEARKYAAQAVRLAERDGNLGRRARVLATVGEFYLTLSPWLAEYLTREALQLEPEHAGATRTLVRALTLRGEPSAVEEAVALVARWGDPASLDRSDRYVVAYLLSQTGSAAELSRAIDLLRGSDRLNRAEQHLLAMLYRKTDRVATAYNLLQRLASDAEASPEELRDYLIFWQDYFLASASEGGQVDFAADARRAYQRLLSLPGAEQRWLELKLRELRLVDGEQPLPEATVQQLVEQLLQSDAVVARSSPSYDAGLLSRILQQLLIADLQAAAVAVATQSIEQVPPDQAQGILCDAVKQSASRGATLQPIVWQALSAIGNQPEVPVELLHAVGEAQIIGGRYDDAQQTYRQILRRRPNHVTALNNLAAVMAEQPDGLPVARRLCGQALELAPERIDVLDTRAMVELGEGNSEAAVELWQRLVQQQPDHPVLWLHLSMAEHAAGNDRAAERAFIQSLAAGVSQQVLPSKERQFVQSMQARLPQVGLEANTSALR